jgi:integrase
MMGLFGWPRRGCPTGVGGRPAGERWEDHGLVFLNTLGKPLEPRNVVRSFKHRLTTLSLPDARFYDLRHTCASFLLAQGVEPRVVMEILGHAQYSFTMKTYAHVLPAMRRDAASRMDEILRG